MSIKLDDHVEVFNHPYGGIGKYGRVVRIREEEDEKVYHVDCNGIDGDQVVFSFYPEEIKLAIVEAD